VSPRQCIECGAVATAARTICGIVIALCEVHADEVDADEVDADSQHGAGEEDARMATIQQTIQDLEAESVDVRVSDERGTVPGVRVTVPAAGGSRQGRR
jgi:ribosomal protein S12 methylthiotransferase accessory factor YcaO